MAFKTCSDNKPQRIIRLSEVASRLGISKSYAYVLQTKGLLPSPIKIVEGGRAAGYLETEIDAFINSRFSASRGAADYE